MQTNDELAGGEGGATGSRLISGNHPALTALESRIARHHGHPAALLFPSGYVANLGLLSALLRRGDVLLYDELMHASARDGLRLGQARTFRFRHNDVADLKEQLARHRGDGQTFVLTEGRFSMDGDLAPLTEIAAVCTQANARLLVDEAHSGGLEGDRGAGLVAALGLQDQTLATVITYGKAFGSHGAAVLGSSDLRDYLINVCRPFIYSTAPPPGQTTDISRAYDRMEALHAERLAALRTNIEYFRKAVTAAGLADHLPPVDGPVQPLRLPGNEAVMVAEAACRDAGLLVKGIRSPTVAVGAERVRVCLHAFNTSSEIEALVTVLAGAVRGQP